MAESIGQTEEKSVPPQGDEKNYKNDKKGKDKDKKQDFEDISKQFEPAEDLETIRDKLVAVKQAIAKIEDPAADEDPELTAVEAPPKALTKAEKKRLAK